MILETKRLILRPFDETDAESLYEYAKDDRVGPIAGWPPHKSVENSREVIKNVLSAPETYAVCLKEDNKAIGSIGLMIGKNSNLDLPENEGEIGFWLGVPFWGQGLIPEAVKELIRHAFIDLHLETLWCGYFDGNEKSKRAQEKCGFTYHHTNKDIYWKLMDDIRTEHITRLTKEEWKAGFTVRKLEEHETQAALSLAWKVFLAYEAPDYSPEGTEEFHHALHDESYLAGLEYFGAFDRDVLVGMVGIRKDKCHICFFFVNGKYHRLGIGTRLFERIKTEYTDKTITLNSSPYGLPFYRSLGFHETDSEQTVNGIRFTPMVYRQYRVKNKMHKLKRKFFLVIACFMLIMTLTACRNADFVGNSYKIGNSITIEFQSLNTAQAQEIDLKSGDTVRFDVTREVGQIDIAFGLKDAKPDYEGKSVGSNSFTVTVHEDGRYVLTVTGSKAKGSVKLTKMEQK